MKTVLNMQVENDGLCMYSGDICSHFPAQSPGSQNSHRASDWLPPVCPGRANQSPGEKLFSASGDQYPELLAGYLEIQKPGVGDLFRSGPARVSDPDPHVSFGML